MRPAHACVHVWTLQSGLISLKMQHSDLWGAELHSCKVVCSCHGCLSSCCCGLPCSQPPHKHRSHTWFRDNLECAWVFWGINGNKIIKHFVIFLTLFYSSVQIFSFNLLFLELVQSPAYWITGPCCWGRLGEQSMMIWEVPFSPWNDSLKTSYFCTGRYSGFVKIQIVMRERRGCKNLLWIF